MASRVILWQRNGLSPLRSLVTSDTAPFGAFYVSRNPRAAAIKSPAATALENRNAIKSLLEQLSSQHSSSIYRDGDVSPRSKGFPARPKDSSRHRTCRRCELRLRLQIVHSGQSAQSCLRSSEAPRLLPLKLLRISGNHAGTIWVFRRGLRHAEFAPAPRLQPKPRVRGALECRFAAEKVALSLFG